MRTAVRRWQCLVALLLPLGGCVRVGADNLSRDRIDYASTLSEAGKQQTLLNIMRLRYGDSPAFLGVNQIIAGYTAQGTLQAGLNAYPSATTGNFATFLGTVQYTDRPTFTFAPIDGEKYAYAYLRPLSPAEILSLAQSGVPIDILLRIAVQSLNGLQSSSILQPHPSTSTVSFYRVLQGLRRLQEGGGMHVEVKREKAATWVTILFSAEAQHRALIDEIKRLLHLDPKRHAYAIIYGPDTGRRDLIAAVTRPMLGILAQIGAQADVPPDDVLRGRTTASIIDVPEAGHSAIVIRNGEKAPAASYAAVRYGRQWYWVEENDYQSKVAFTVLQVLEALAQSTSSPQAPIVTIPAG